MQQWLSKAFNLSILRQKRLQWVDYLRGIAIILVVYRHVLIGIERSGIIVPSYLTTANLIFFSFRIPLFFILSGIFISASLAKKSVSNLIGIKFETLLYPYLIWSVIQITVQIVLSGYINAERSWIDYSYILYQPRSLDQFWYLPALFNVSVIYLLIKAKIAPPAWAQLLLGLCLFFLSPYIRNISMISDWMEFYIFFALGDALSTYFFKPAFQQKLRSKYSLLIATPFFIIAQLYYLNYASTMAEFLIIALIGCATMFILAFKLQDLNILSFLRVIGYHSLYIYVMHVLASAPARILFSRVFGIQDPAILLILGIIFGITIPIMFYNLIVHNNVGWFLFSYRRKKPELKKTTPQRELAS